MKILVVEDGVAKEKRVLAAIFDVPGMAQSDVSIARSVIGAKRKLAEQRFDVLILDIQIPQHDGERVRVKGGAELLESLMTSKRIACPPHVIGLSAFDSNPEIDAAFERNTSVIVKYDARDSAWEEKLQVKIDQILAHESGSSICERNEHFVVLVHGIRTHANWAEMVAEELTKNGIRPVPIRFGYLDAFRFWCPVFFRHKPIMKILREIRDLRAEFPNAKISVICHSFGTFSIFQCLLEPDVKLYRVIFCGSIVPVDFRRTRFKAQLGPDPILNDCGTKDWWPIVAKTATWGYGPSGTFGFGTLGVRDRFNEYGHSDYFNREFVVTYWIPFLLRGEIISTPWESNRRTPSWWMSLPLWFQMKWVAVVLVILVALWFWWKG